MTTIVYDHKNKKIAVDGRFTQGDLIHQEDGEKWIKDDDGWWFLAGAPCDYEDFIGAIKSKQKQERDFQLSAFFVDNSGRVYSCFLDSTDMLPKRERCTSNDVMGSGSPFALSALDHGKSAKEAVEYAKTRDCGTGGLVRVFDVERMEFV